MSKRRATKTTLTAQRLRRALSDALRDRQAASDRIADCSREVLRCLLANDTKGALAAREREFAALCRRGHLNDLIARIRLEFDRTGGKAPALDMEWIDHRAPGLLRAAAAALSQPTVIR